MKKQPITLFIAVLILLQFYSLGKIHSLQRSVDSANNAINFGVSQMNNQISSIYRKVEESLEKQVSFIHNASITLGELDMDTLTVPVTYIVEPKTITETMTLALDFNGELVPLEQSGLIYTVTKQCGLWQKSILPTIVLQDRGVTTVEEHGGLEVSRLKDQVLPYMEARFFGESSYGSKEFRMNGALEIFGELKEGNNPFVSVKFVVKVEDEIIKETVIPLEGRSFSDMSTLEIDETYDLLEGQTLTGYVVAVDSYGFTHEYLVTHYVAGSNMQREPYSEEATITAPRAPYLNEETIIAPNGEIVNQLDEMND